MKTYTFFPGCSLEGTAKEFATSSHEVFNRLGLKLEELEDWSCCGATAGHCVDKLLSLALPARNLFLAKEKGNDSLATSCAACFSRLKTASHHLKQDPETRKQIETALEKSYPGDVAVRHILEILLQDVNASTLKEAIVKPLQGLKLVTYYGCLLVRPPKIMQFDDPENPTSMDKLLEAAGAEILPWGFKTECCGASLTLSRADLVCTLTQRILSEAKSVGADAIAVACPLCQTNLDMRQLDLRSQKLIDFEIPVLYFTQLLGIAMGIPAKKLGLSKHFIPAGDKIASLERQPSISQISSQEQG